MKEAVLERVKQFISAKSMSVNAFANKIGMYQNTVNNQINGVRSISLDLVLQVLNIFPEVSAEWLLRGEGAMLKSDRSTNTYHVTGTENRFEMRGDVQGDVNNNQSGSTDKDAIIQQLLAQQSKLMDLLAKK